MYHRIFLLLWIYLASGFASNAQTPNLRLLEGNWAHIDTGGGVTGEIWKMTSQGAKGEGYFTLANSTEIQEKLSIQKFSETWCYIAAPNQQKPVMFCADSISTHFWRFVNFEHDFPKVIQYQFIRENELEIIIHNQPISNKSVRFNLFKED
jgi:hypothetical protein